MNHCWPKIVTGTRAHMMESQPRSVLRRVARMIRCGWKIAALCLPYLLLVFLCLPVSATVNVKDYGAQGDGKFNDTAALNTGFLNACTASEDVYIPAGTYLVNSFDKLQGCGMTIY